MFTICDTCFGQLEKPKRTKGRLGRNTCAKCQRIAASISQREKRETLKRLGLPPYDVHKKLSPNGKTLERPRSIIT